MATRIKVKRILELLEKDLSANEIARTYSISTHSIHAVLFVIVFKGTVLS